MTAIAARIKPAIFEIVFVPAFPSSFMINGERRNITQAIIILIIRLKRGKKIPYSFERIIEVVSTAGPTMRGTPIGTAPRLSESIKRCFFSAVKISRTLIINKIMPPAIIKS